MTRCYKCERLLGADGFYPSSLRQMREHNRTAALCKDCRREWQRERIRVRGRATITRTQGILRAEKRRYVQDKKVAIGCTSCGEKHPACLEWHHTGEHEKDDSLARMIDKNRPYGVLDAEMAKCVVLCSNCHRKQHWDSEERSKYVSLIRSA